jgi:hypothetical protein
MTQAQKDVYSRPLRLNFFENSNGKTDGLQPEIMEILPKVVAVFHEKTGNPHFNVHINAGQEWHNGHKLMSLHHTGYAVDFQTIKLLGGGVGRLARSIEAAVKANIGPKYRVELETHPPHLHVEFRAGLRVSNPGDFPLSNNG